ncbi:MAG TPA: hypothetical protein VMV22_11390 [Acidimicrobiales bacterium]|nr:hypothetical protein [Acidimicrobiales bacterium]
MGWSEVLDDIERRLTDVKRGLRTGEPATTPFTLPEDLGPLPVQLRLRAQRALRATEAMQADVEEARDRIADALRRGRATTREPAAYVDTRI